MSEAPSSRPVPIGRLATSNLLPRPGRHRAGGPPLPSRAGARAPGSWPWMALGAAALYPLLLFSTGLLAAALRPVPQTVTETAHVPPAATPEEDEPSWPAAAEAGPAAEPVEPGEARPLSRDGRVRPSEEMAAAPDPAITGPSPASCQRLGTAIDFVRSPAVAFARAAREQKLVMVLHLAGNFDDPGFT